jgi:hypothetical protein
MCRACIEHVKRRYPGWLQLPPPRRRRRSRVRYPSSPLTSRATLTGLTTVQARRSARRSPLRWIGRARAWSCLVPPEHDDDVAGSGIRPIEITTWANLEIPPDQVAPGAGELSLDDSEVRGTVPSRRLERMAGLSPSRLPAFSVLKVPVRPCPRGILIPPLTPRVTRAAYDRGRRGVAQRRRGRRNPIGYLFSVTSAPATTSEPSGEQVRTDRLKTYAASGLIFSALGLLSATPPTPTPRATVTARSSGGKAMTARLTVRQKGNGHVND